MKINYVTIKTGNQLKSKSCAICPVTQVFCRSMSVVMKGLCMPSITMQGMCCNAHVVVLLQRLCHAAICNMLHPTLPLNTLCKLLTSAPMLMQLTFLNYNNFLLPPSASVLATPLYAYVRHRPCKHFLSMYIL